MSRTIVDFHIIQTVPPSNINRDDTGTPKTAIYGGTRRARVSSQAWKRATRDTFDSLLDRSDLGVRTKRVVELLGDRIIDKDGMLKDDAYELAGAALAAAGIKTVTPRNKENLPESEFLVFLGDRQIDNLAQLAVDAVHAAGDGKPSFDKKTAATFADQEHSIDVSLFGRMVANATELSVDASAQVAHALSVHTVENEFDYYTAVDDHKKNDDEEDSGAGMIGTVEFNSSTLYRYANVDVNKLHTNLGDATATRRAVEAFARAFTISMPTGKQNTFANRTLPDAVLVVVRDTQPINLVGAFEEAVDGRPDGGRIAAAAHRLVDHAQQMHRAYGQVPVAAWSFGVGAPAGALTQIGAAGSLDATVTALGELVASRLAEPA